MPANLEERVTAGMRFGHLSAIAPARQLYGVEVEVEGVTSTDGLAGWAPHTDGSLRNHGMEFVTDPIAADTVVSRLENLYETKRRNGWVTSIRTGIHVHADMRLKTGEQLRRLLACYVLTEAPLFSYVGRERETSIFCVPYYLAPHGLQAFSRYLRRGGDTIRLLHETHKYSALNLSSITRLGTIEFRQAPTWDTLTPALVWAGLIDSLVTHSADISVESALRMAGDDYRGFLRTLYGTQERSLSGDSVTNDADDLVKEFLLLPCTYKEAAAWPKADCSTTPTLKKPAAGRGDRITFNQRALLGGGGGGGLAALRRMAVAQPMDWNTTYDMLTMITTTDATEVAREATRHLQELEEYNQYDEPDDDDYDEPEETEDEE